MRGALARPRSGSSFVCWSLARASSGWLPASSGWRRPLGRAGANRRPECACSLFGSTSPCSRAYACRGRSSSWCAWSSAGPSRSSGALRRWRAWLSSVPPCSRRAPQLSCASSPRGRLGAAARLFAWSPPRPRSSCSCPRIANGVRRAPRTRGSPARRAPSRLRTRTEGCRPPPGPVGSCSFFACSSAASSVPFGRSIRVSRPKSGRLRAGSPQSEVGAFGRAQCTAYAARPLGDVGARRPGVVTERSGSVDVMAPSTRACRPRRLPAHTSARSAARPPRRRGSIIDERRAPRRADVARRT